jgi:hypothetical protein
MGVLYAVQYAHRASGSFSFHPFPISFVAFRRMFLICLLDVSAWLWQTHLNYPGSSALAITIKATPTQTPFKQNNSWSVG